jgi:hypothetical protein
MTIPLPSQEKVARGVVEVEEEDADRTKLQLILDEEVVVAVVAAAVAVAEIIIRTIIISHHEEEAVVEVVRLINAKHIELHTLAVGYNNKKTILRPRRQIPAPVLKRFDCS